MEFFDAREKAKVLLVLEMLPILLNSKERTPRSFDIRYQIRKNSRDCFYLMKPRF